MKTAMVHDWLIDFRGAEKVVEQIVQIPELGIEKLYTLLFSRSEFSCSPIGTMEVEESVLVKLPLSKKLYRQYILFLPFAAEQFDLSEYDMVISSSHSVAKGVITRSDQLHISYCHTPMRYVWDLYHLYLRQMGLTKGIKGNIVRLIFHYVRMWDYLASKRVDLFIANSKYIARRIRKHYGREATVIYPPVDTERFMPSHRRDDYFITVSHLVPYKRVDLIVRAFNKMKLPLVVIGDGPDMRAIKSLADSNIELLGRLSDQELAEYVSRARAFVYTAEEDFGIVPVEAQASGIPVIAFGKSGVSESVIEGKTGVLFEEQNVASLIGAVQRFIKNEDRFDPAFIRSNAERFSSQRFRHEFRDFVLSKYEDFKAGKNVRV
ncbi:MAG: glycosyltransferase family 4 protein [candidate division WOR-3 bacterium]